MALGTQKYTQRLWTIRILTGLVIGICVMLLWSVYERFVIERDMAARREAVEAEYESLQQREQNLRERVEYLSQDESVESEIRKHFDVARAGEQVVILVDGDDTQATSSVPEVEVDSPWYQFWR